ncbi:MAG: four helix bundle protein [Microthrixaceae bacterium]|nr:four helix bundle protein [Microthrixaceae bacterium]
MRTHKDLLAWRRAREVVLSVQRHADRRWSPGRAALLEQLRRSSLSVMLNLAEGYAHGPGKRCRAHLKIAYGSAVESTDVLELLEELGDDSLAKVSAMSREVQAMTLKLWQRSVG